MKKSRWFNLLIIFGAAIFLIFLVVKSLSINLEKHQQYQQALAYQNEEKAIINQELLKSRYELFFSYDPLVNHLSDLKETQQQLNLVPNFIEGGGQTRFQQILVKNAESIEQADILIERFKSQNAAFKNSLRYLPSLVAEIAEKSSSRTMSPRFSVALDELVQNILLYNLTSSEELTSSIKTNIEKLKQIKAENIREEDRFLIDLANRHAEIILNYKPKIDQLTQSILQLLNTQQSEELDQAYNSYYQKAVNEANIYRHFAYGWSLILLGWIAYLAIIRIIKLLKKSQQAELALQKMNKELEAKVKERTAQLSELWAQECLSEKKQRRAKEKLQQRIVELQTEIASVSQGDLTIRARVTEDEIGAIADFYNSTLENLRQIVVQVQTVVQQVVSNTKSNEAAIQTLSEDALTQKQEIETARENIHAMTESIRSITAKAERAEALVTPMVHTGEKGSVFINRAIDEMLSIQSITVKTNKKIQLLKTASQKISQLMDIVHQVARQNNGLAVYSSDEELRPREKNHAVPRSTKASPANEQGQNLSLILDQSLKHQSKQVNDEIYKLIVEIQQEINEVIVTMREGIAETSKKAQIIKQTRQSLNHIASTSTQLNQLINSISRSAFEQSQASETVNQILDKATTLTSKTSISANDVSTSFNKLLRATEKLQDSVSQFKVN